MKSHLMLMSVFIACILLARVCFKHGSSAGFNVGALALIVCLAILYFYVRIVWAWITRDKTTNQAEKHKDASNS